MSTHLRLAVSDLDTYRYWLAREEAPLEALLSDLRRETPPTPAMLRSRAFHAALEHAACEEEVRVLAEGDYQFVFALEDETLVLPAHPELRGEYDIETAAGRVTLAGRVDGLDGLSIRECKLTERFEPERYADSLQWRAYLAMFNAVRLDYDIFEWRADGKWTVIYNRHRFPVYAYPEMRLDVDEVTEELAVLLTDGAYPGPWLREAA